jgi:4,5-dihydroxyphthalate decarboxylase
MSRLDLTYAGVTYLDRTRALEFGEISPEGVNLRYLAIDDIGDLFRRVAQHAEFEASEMSLSTYMMLRGRGDDRFVAIPVFPSRSFRHGFVFVNSKSGIEQPADLKGRRVGIAEYQMTAALWIRAFLEHDYGVTPRDVQWLTGGEHKPGYRERMSHQLPDGVKMDVIPEDKYLTGMLDDGEIDALVTAEMPLPFLKRSPNVRRLFEDHRAVESEYYDRTGFFPIMHVVVIRRDVYERNPWLAAALLSAFCRSKAIGSERLRDLGALRVSLPWLSTALEEIDARFDGDAFPYGFGPNREILSAMTTYAHEQGFTAERLEPESLFAKETLEHPADEAVEIYAA